MSSQIRIGVEVDSFITGACVLQDNFQVFQVEWWGSQVNRTIFSFNNICIGLFRVVVSDQGDLKLGRMLSIKYRMFVLGKYKNIKNER